jgi:NitT/TauT family transport system substrate-binding protein
VGDVLTAATLSEKGTPVRIVTVMLGADPTEGRYGVVVPRTSRIAQPMQLRGVPVAVASGTTAEYVVDSLLKAEGLADNEVKKVEVDGIPVAMQLLLAGEVKAACLSDPLLASAEGKRAKLVIADTAGQNLSQTILAFPAAYVEENGDTLAKLIAADARAVAAINGDPEKYRKLLIDKADLPRDIAATYRPNSYPKPQLPARADVDRVLVWTGSKGLTTPRTTYETLVATGLTER